MAAEEEVRAANDRFYEALNAMLEGAVDRLEAVWSHADDVTNLGPFGSRQAGWEEVKKQFSGEAGRRIGGHVSPRDFLIRAAGYCGWAVGVEIGENLAWSIKAVMMSHRVTNIFRREGGEWKLVHHHTDPAPGLQSAFEPPGSRDVASDTP